jgi:hypothetical protein
MRRKIKHLKRYKSYPKNVPRKLLKSFFDFDCSVSKLATDRRVNSGTISALLNDGHEPKDSSIRVKLFLTPNPICKSCGRKVIHHSTKPKIDKPEFMKEWSHLPTEERHRVIKQYLQWKENQ